MTAKAGCADSPSYRSTRKIAPERRPANEFDLVDDAEADEEALKARLLARQRQQTFTRAAAIDRGDEMMPGM